MPQFAFDWQDAWVIKTVKTPLRQPGLTGFMIYWEKERKVDMTEQELLKKADSFIEENIEGIIKDIKAIFPA